MMESIVPISLLGLPPPWNNLAKDPRDAVKPSDAAVADALLVLDRCLEAVSALPNVPPEEFPDYITIAWSLWDHWVAIGMPSFDEFRLEPIAKAFHKQDPDVSSALVRRYGDVWLREQALRRTRLAQSWLFDSLRRSAQAETIERLRGAAERHWRVDPVIAFSLLYDLWFVDPQGTRALLEQVVASPDAPVQLATDLKHLLARTAASPG